MTLAWEQVIVASADPPALGNWWATALGWTVVADEPGEFEIQPTRGVIPGLLFVPVAEAKAGKNRLHLDFRPAGTAGAAPDQAAEVVRLEGLGARRIDVGQGDDVPWIVMADPEGNEFCVLSAPSAATATVS
jgi:hypothetical protein